MSEQGVRDMQLETWRRELVVAWATGIGVTYEQAHFSPDAARALADALQQYLDREEWERRARELDASWDREIKTLENARHAADQLARGVTRALWVVLWCAAAAASLNVYAALLAWWGLA